MLFPRSFDICSFQRKDELNTNEFLTSHAAALAEQGLLSQAELQEIKLTLNQAWPELSTDQPIMLKMEASHSDFLTQLQARFGSINLIRNLLRFSLSKQLDEVIASLSQWGCALVPKAELLFNRPIYIYIGESCEETKLFASIILDLSEMIETVTIELTTLQSMTRSMLPNSLAQASDRDASIDQTIAKQLGFHQVVTEGVPLLTERLMLRRLTRAMEDLIEITEAAARQISLNQARDTTTQLLISCEAMSGYLKQLTAMSLPTTDSLLTWEAKRINTLTTIGCLSLTLEEVIRHFMLLTDAYENLVAGTANVPNDVVRSMATVMVRQGVSANAATTASQRLLTYLKVHKIQAKDMIPAELGKIDPALTGEAMTVLQKWEADQTLTYAASNEKERNLNRQRKLMKAFTKVSRSTALGSMMLLLLGTCLGCGWKSPPISNEPDFRPSIPYQSTPLPAPTLQQNLEKDDEHESGSK